MANQPYTPKPITDIFTPDTDIDRRQCKRVVPMRVLALGLGRTGTACELPNVNLSNPQILNYCSSPVGSARAGIH